MTTATTVTEDRHQSQQRALMARLARIEGQVRGVRRMMEQGEECESVAQQLAAARRALNKCFYEMMSCAIEQELDGSGVDTDEAMEGVRHMTRLLAKYG